MNHNKAYISINEKVVDSAIFFNDTDFEKIKRVLYNRNKYRIYKKDHIDIWFDKITFITEKQYNGRTTKKNRNS